MPFRNPPRGQPHPYGSSRIYAAMARNGRSRLRMWSTARRISKWHTTQMIVSSCGGVRHKRATKRRRASSMRRLPSARRWPSTAPGSASGIGRPTLSLAWTMPSGPVNTLCRCLLCERRVRRLTAVKNAAAGPSNLTKLIFLIGF